MQVRFRNCTYIHEFQVKHAACVTKTVYNSNTFAFLLLEEISRKRLIKAGTVQVVRTLLLFDMKSNDEERLIVHTHLAALESRLYCPTQAHATQKAQCCSDKRGRYDTFMTAKAEPQNNALKHKGHKELT